MLAKKIIIAAILIITVIGSMIIGASCLNQLACEGQPINNNVDPTPAQQILGDRIIAQSFIAPRNGLNRIDIFFHTYGRKNTHDVTLRLLELSPEIQNPVEGKEVFSTIFNAATISDQVWQTFNLPPIENSAGNTYVIALHSPESEDGNAITVGGIEQNVYVPGSAFLGPTPVRADITFRSCYQMTTFEKLQIFSEQITRHRPGPWGNITIYGLSLLTYVLLLVGFFWQLAKLALD